jgi:hypothetical protein
MNGYSRNCIPVVRFVITRGESSFSIEFYLLPNTYKISRSCPNREVLKTMTFVNNSISSFNQVLAALSCKKSLVPFRNSLLTKMLKPFFSKSGGNVAFMATLLNDTNVQEQVLETMLAAKYLRRINKAQGLPTSSTGQEGSQ